MNEIFHSCSYFCNNPACVKYQRDSLRDKFVVADTEPDQHLPFKVFAEPRGVRFTIGVQTFTLDDTQFEPEHPYRQNAYIGQLTSALSRLCTPPKATP